MGLGCRFQVLAPSEVYGVRSWAGEIEIEVA